jgi:hypothetical protein
MPQADVMDRFTAIPLDAVLWLSGISIRVETNCQAVVDQLERAHAPSMESAGDAPDFLLRVVAESHAHQAMCFISQNIATDDAQFSQQFLPARLSLLAESIETLS